MRDCRLVWIPNETHRRVKLFAARHGIKIYEAYDMLIKILLDPDGAFKKREYASEFEVLKNKSIRFRFPL